MYCGIQRRVVYQALVIVGGYVDIKEEEIRNLPLISDMQLFLFLAWKLSCPSEFDMLNT